MNEVQMQRTQEADGEITVTQGKQGNGGRMEKVGGGRGWKAGGII